MNILWAGKDLLQVDLSRGLAEAVFALAVCHSFLASSLRRGTADNIWGTIFLFQPCKAMCETGDCRQQEFKDRAGNCVLCKQCGPGMELSKVQTKCMRGLTLDKAFF